MTLARPDTKTLLKIPVTCWIRICVILTFGQAQISAQNADYRILKTLNSGERPQWDKAMKRLSFSVYVLEPVPPVGISLQGFFTKDKEMLWNGYKSAISLCAALAISTGLKYSVKRQRPYDRHPGDIIKRDSTATFSFPSGHTTAAFATATAMSLTYKKWYVTVPAFIYAGFAAYSRMRLGMHYPTDVAGGIILGSGSALLTWHLAKKITQKKIKPLPPDN
jgi:membrane-associated phospholipid phosphatase